MARARPLWAQTGAPAAAILLLAGATSTTARAQTIPSLDMRTWRPSTDADASLILEPVATAGPWQWNAAAWLQYAQNPIVYRDRSGRGVRPVAHFVGLDLTAGMGIGDRVAVGLELPVIVWQNGEPLPAYYVEDGKAPTAGIGDLTAQGKVVIVPNDVRKGIHSGFGLAALGAVQFPIGNRASFLSNGTFGGSLSVLGEYALEVGAVRAEVGYTVRGTERVWPAAVGVLEDLPTFGQSIPWSIGLVVRPKLFAQVLDSGDRQLWEIAGHGSLPGGPTAPFTAGASRLSPALVAIDDRIAVGHDRDTRLLIGVDIGVDKAIGVPAFRGVFAVQWAPRLHDKDDDGVPDDRDECPELAEDRDGIQDADGCPEDDADGDGVLDTDDACPLVPGVASSDPKQNGCPGAPPAPAGPGDAPPGPAEAPQGPAQAPPAPQGPPEGPPAPAPPQPPEQPRP
jgi:hypothetical protein